MLEEVGFWKLREDDASDADPAKLACPGWGASVEGKRVAKYLRNGAVYEHCFGYSWCRVCGQTGVSMG
jgi:hypothetical protein